jgi:DNA-directed RNA polymerase specialized sigma24 family protein
LIDILFNKEECRIALSLVSKLERDILILKWIEGQSIRDISLALGKTENAIKLIISRAKKKIRKLLHEAK